MIISTKKSFDALLSKAKEGDVDAQFSVADIYSDGLRNKKDKVIVKQNYKHAYKWFEKAAINGDISALNNLGNFVCDGIGCEKDINKAIEIYKEAISRGNSGSAINLGTIYRDQGDYQTAFEQYVLAQELDKITYSFKVGQCYYLGLGVAMDKVQACKIFSKVSIDIKGYHNQYERDEANYLLGLSYLTGDGVKQSSENARKYLVLANTDNDHRSSEELLVLIGRE